MKQCSKCKEVKELIAYTRKITALDGYSYICKECKKAYDRAHYAQTIDRQTDRNRRAYSANRQQRIEYQREWHKHNRDVSKKWKQENPHKNREYCSARKSRKLTAGGRYTQRDIERILKMQRHRCACCKKSLRIGFEVDHIVPLSKGGTNFPKNIQLMTPSCNSSKYNRDPIEYMQSKGLLL